MTTCFEEVKQFQSNRAGNFDALAKRLADGDDIPPETVLATIEADGRSIENLEAEVARRRKRAGLRKALEETTIPIPGQAEAAEALAQADAAEAQRRAEFAEKRLKLAAAAAAFDPIVSPRVNARRGLENQLAGLSRKVKPELKVAHVAAQREVEVADKKKKELRDRLHEGEAAVARAKERVANSSDALRVQREKDAADAAGFVERARSALAAADQEFAAAVARQNEAWQRVQDDEIAAAAE